MVMDLDTGIQEFRPRDDGSMGPCKGIEQPRPPGPVPGPSARMPRPAFRCFRCNQLGHHTVECPNPAPKGKSESPAKVTLRKTPEKSRAVQQAEGSMLWGERPKTEDATSMIGPQLIVYDEDTGNPEDPMVSEPIHPFTIPIVLVSPHSGCRGEYDALIDTGCTQCLISEVVVKKVGIRVRPLRKPVWFKQVDGSLLGGVPATFITEPVQMELGEHWEVIRFVVVPSMMEAVILGLAWLDKWGPTIW